MNICIICVNYNSYNSLEKYLASLTKSLSYSDAVNLKVVIANNSTQDIPASFFEYINSLNLDYIFINNDNIGYFPAFSKTMDTLGNMISYDYIIISNVDLTVDESFFNTLKSKKFTTDIGVVAPAIISTQNNNDLNPKIINRPSRLQLYKNLLLFKFTYVFIFYSFLSTLKAKSPTKKNISQYDIYAPHGSFIIFTKSYFAKGANINYPRFLFGEEIFVGEQCIKTGQRVRYDPDILIHDNEHGSTSKEKSKFISQEHVKSLAYLLEHYF